MLNILNYFNRFMWHRMRSLQTLHLKAFFSTFDDVKIVNLRCLEVLKTAVKSKFNCLVRRQRQNNVIVRHFFKNINN